MSSRELEARVEAIAGGQHGNITHSQLTALGLGRAAIAYRAKTGRLRPVHFGVYGLGRLPKTALERASAAVLACGPDALLCGPSAFTLWGFQKQWFFPAHVCCPTNRTRPGIVTHRFPSLARRDLRTHNNIRVTSPARTFLDHTPNLNRQQIRRALADARRSRHLRAPALYDVLDRNPTHPGATALKAAIAGFQPTRSDWEDALPVFCKDNDLPIPQLNTTVSGYEIDAYYPEYRLILELDSWAYHRDRGSFESDRDRDAHQLSHGIATVRITWERMTETPSHEAARLRKILDGLSKR